MDPSKTISSYKLKHGEELVMLTKWLTPLDDVRMTTEADPISGATEEDNPRAVMSCGHAFTPETLTAHARTYISENLRTEIKCPLSNQGSGDLQCLSNNTWDYRYYIKAAKLDEKELKFFDTKLSRNYIQKNLQIQECPTCKSFVFREDQKLVRVSCVACKLLKKQTFDFCFYCLHQWRSSSMVVCGNEGCSRIKIMNQFLANCETITVDGVSIRGIPDIRACPLDSHPKDHPFVWGHAGGCKHQKCPICEGEFCWICLNPKKNGVWQCGAWDSPCRLARRQTIQEV